MAKPKRRKATVHSAGKVTEADLLENARALRDDPSLAMPVCEGPCILFSPVTAARRGIAKAHAAREDEAKLTRLASGGNDLARAYAAALLVARADKLPYVAELRLGGGESVPYANRGKAKPFFIAGLLHHDDRARRLLSVTPWAKKRKMNFFSTERGIVCTGRSAKPPEDFVREEAELLGLHAVSPSVYACEHGGAAPDRDAVVLDWDTAGVEMQRCAACAADGSVFRDLLRHMAGPERRRHFRARAHLAPLAGAPLDVTFELPKDVTDKYLAGAIGDAALLDAGRAARVEALRALGRRVYVAGDQSFGDAQDQFIDALNPSDAERRALVAALAQEEGPIVLDRATSARALAELWPRHARIMLEAAAGHAGTAESLHKESVTPEEAAELVRRAAREGSARSVSETLPRYGQLPPAAAVADAIARAYRAQGRDSGARVATERAAGGKGKGVALAALQEMDAAKGQEWRFAGADHDVAASVREPMRALLTGPSEGYHDALQLVSRLSGETQEFTPTSR